MSRNKLLLYKLNHPKKCLSPHIRSTKQFDDDSAYADTNPSTACSLSSLLFNTSRSVTGSNDGDSGMSENSNTLVYAPDSNNENESRKGGVKGEKEAPLLERYFNSAFKCWTDKLSRCNCLGEGQVLNNDGQQTDLPL
jgi:hypothetical protein